MTSSTSTVVTQGTRTYVSGGASKINTSALVEAAYKQRTAEADKIDVRVKRNVSRQSAFNELQSLSKSLQTSLTALRQSYGAVASNSSAFAKKTGSITTAANGINVSQILTASIDTSAQLGEYSIEVMQLAQAHKVSSSNYTDPAVAQGITGSFNIGETGATSAQIDVTAGMSLNDIAIAVNAQSGTTKVSASVAKISATQYQLVFSAVDSNKPITQSFVSGTDVLQTLGIATGGVFSNVIQPPKDAQIKVDGVTYSRDSNKFNDILTGVEFNLLSASPGTAIRLKTENDTSAVKDSIMSFVESYNALRDFFTKNNTVAPDGSVSEDAVLYKDTILSSLSQTVQGLLGQKYGLGGTSLSSLREIGIKLDRTNKLEVDESVLDVAISNKFAEVKSMFETKFTSSNSQFTLLSNSSSTTSATVTFDITHDGSAITGVTANGVAGLFDISGGAITGKAGTVYEGMKFAYVGNTSTTLTFDMTQGFADLASNALDRFTNVSSGTIKGQNEAIERENTAMNARADRVRERAADFRDKLIERYGKFEALMNRNETTLAQIRAILNINKSNN